MAISFVEVSIRLSPGKREHGGLSVMGCWNGADDAITLAQNAAADEENLSRKPDISDT